MISLRSLGLKLIHIGVHSKNTRITIWVVLPRKKTLLLLRHHRRPSDYEHKMIPRRVMARPYQRISWEMKTSRRVPHSMSLGSVVSLVAVRLCFMYASNIFEALPNCNIASLVQTARWQKCSWQTWCLEVHNDYNVLKRHFSLSTVDCQAQSSRLSSSTRWHYSFCTCSLIQMHRPVIKCYKLEIYLTSSA